MKKFLITTVLLLVSAIAFASGFAQDESLNTGVEMADTFRKEGKIYVVVAILGIVLVGLLAYAFNIDRKISKLEKQAEINS